MPHITLRNVTNFILKNLNLDILDQEIMAVLGRSGAGKTTLLKAIAGLVEYSGSIMMDGKPIDDLPPEKRNVGYVPQNLALFPHMKVEDNIAYGLKIRGLSEKSIKERVRYVMDLLDILHLKNRYPLTLSGGERQRAAIARALVIDPKLLLLDEPLSNLNVGLRLQISAELKKIRRGLGVTMIYVTHNVDEARELGDRIAVMDDGKIITVGSYEELLAKKMNILSDILYPHNVLRCSLIEKIPEGLVKVRCRDLTLIATFEDRSRFSKVVIPSNRVYLSFEKPRIRVNVFEAKIIDVKLNRNIYEVTLSVNETLLKSTASIERFNPSELRIGKSVYIQIPIRYITIL